MIDAVAQQRAVPCREPRYKAQHRLVNLVLTLPVADQTRQSQTADFAPGLQFAGTAYDDSVKRGVNTLEISDYLYLQQLYTCVSNLHHNTFGIIFQFTPLATCSYNLRYGFEF